MQRDEVIETLAGLAGPLGPITTIDEWLSRQARWIDEGGLPLFDALMDLIVSPPPPQELRGVSPEEWHDLLVEIAGTLGKRHRDAAMPRLLPLLDSDDERTRQAVMAILGSVGDARAVPALARLVRDRPIAAEAELVSLACTLGEIGGETACQLLADLQNLATPNQGELLQEITIAQQTAGCHARIESG